MWWPLHEPGVASGGLQLRRENTGSSLEPHAIEPHAMNHTQSSLLIYKGRRSTVSDEPGNSLVGIVGLRHLAPRRNRITSSRRKIAKVLLPTSRHLGYGAEPDATRSIDVLAVEEWTCHPPKDKWTPAPGAASVGDAVHEGPLASAHVPRTVRLASCNAWVSTSIAVSASSIVTLMGGAIRNTLL